MSEPIHHAHPDFSSHLAAPRYLSADTPGTGGVLKQRPEDFFVEEVPLYHPRGSGEHIYLFVEKRGMPAIEMLGVIADHFGVRRGDVGHAGLKDKVAITRQTISVYAPGRTAEDFPSLQHPRLSVLWADLHTNKIKRGHLAGNRFSIRVRGVDPRAVLHASRTLQQLERDGVPNRFGPQRFGYLGNNHLVGRAILLNECREALDLILMPNDRSPAGQTQARQLYAEGRYAEAYEAFPKSYRAERLALRALAETNGDPTAGARAIDPTAGSYLVSAFQSAVFNDVLNRRVVEGTLGTLRPGDLAHNARRKNVFPVTHEIADDPELRARMERFEIAPSGPLWGTEMLRADGPTDDAELAALAAAGMTPEDLMGEPAIPRLEMTRGDRRPLRIRLRDPDVEGGVDEHGPYIRCAFELPKGSFATTVMDEVMKLPTGAQDANDAN